MPRGTLQAVCVHQPFDEASRLGLPADTEAELRARQPSLRGVLVLSELLPEGPAAAALEVGDILLKVGGEWCTSFVELEAASQKVAALEQALADAQEREASLDEAVETVGGALEGLLGDTPPAPPLSEPDAVADRGDGSYIVAHALPRRGTYTVDVSLDGAPLAGSPFRCVVAPTYSGEPIDALAQRRRTLATVTSSAAVGWQ